MNLLIYLYLEQGCIQDLCGYFEGAIKKNFTKRIKNLFMLIFATFN